MRITIGLIAVAFARGGTGALSMLVNIGSNSGPVTAIETRAEIILCNSVDIATTIGDNLI